MEGRKFALFLLLVVFFELSQLLNAEANPWFFNRRKKCLKAPAGSRWHNTLRGKFHFKCPRGQSIGVWHSLHDNCKEDRIHRFGCIHSPFRYGNRHCYTTNYVNRFDGKVKFTCPLRGVIAGVKSYYSRHHRDRRFSFRCCSRCSYRRIFCHWTYWKNAWDRPLHFYVPKHYNLVGVYSVHSNHHEDRRYKFRVCKFLKRRRRHWRNETELSYEQGRKRYRMPSKLLVKENA